MKIFVRATQLNEKTPDIVAVYPDTSDVTADAHGDGFVMLHLPARCLRKRDTKDIQDIGVPVLADNWREIAGSEPMAGEATRRIDNAFSQERQLAALHELIELLISHGTDTAKWPPPAKERKARFDQGWQYIRDVQARVGTRTPSNPTSDGNWPARIPPIK